MVLEERSRLNVLGDATSAALAAMESSRSLNQNHFRAHRLLSEANKVECVTLLLRISNTQKLPRSDQPQNATVFNQRANIVHVWAVSVRAGL